MESKKIIKSMIYSLILWKIDVQNSELVEDTFYH